MTSREREILNLIKRNPMISQNELADLLNITRSSVSVHISNLIKKGVIKGKGYVVNEAGHEVVVIGGSNIDITGNLTREFHMHDSNPGEILMSLGGVGRNIAENLAYLDVHVQLISAVGSDLYGDQIMESCQSIGIDTALMKRFGDYRTSVYMQVMNDSGQLEMAISDMDIMMHITPKVLEAHKHQLEGARAIVADGNLPVETIEYLAENYGYKMFFDPVSIAKSSKIMNCLDKIFCITPNIKEAEHILNLEGSSEEILKHMHRKGIAFPVITLGEQGVAYYDQEVNFSPALKIEVKNVTGAGDALMAGLIYGYMNDLNYSDIIKCGQKMASYALSSYKSVNEAIKKINLLEEIKESL